MKLILQATKSILRKFENRMDALLDSVNAVSIIANTAQNTADMAKATADTAKATADTANATADTANAAVEKAPRMMTGIIEQLEDGYSSINVAELYHHIEQGGFVMIKLQSSGAYLTQVTSMSKLPVYTVRLQSVVVNPNTNMLTVYVAELYTKSGRNRSRVNRYETSVNVVQQ